MIDNKSENEIKTHEYDKLSNDLKGRVIEAFVIMLHVNVKRAVEEAKKLDWHIEDFVFLKGVNNNNNSKYIGQSITIPLTKNISKKELSQGIINN